MSKFQCSCGHIIRDNTDYLSYKAHYIADQDLYDFIDELEEGSKDNFASILFKYIRDIYQCTHCNNIFLFKGNFFYEFKPIKENSHSLLMSKKNEKWSGILRGHFIQGKGEIYWETNQQQDFLTGLSREQVELTYYQKFNELLSLGILRDAFLNVDGVIIHKYEN
ncbi:hypothetical protein AB6H10_11790 [Providencia vermicola]|uniref:hypothetical protein n=1 Tax=Providencia vermicola TaxID=333965 RepID=UPI0034DD1FAA